MHKFALTHTAPLDYGACVKGAVMNIYIRKLFLFGFDKSLICYQMIGFALLDPVI